MTVTAGWLDALGGTNALAATIEYSLYRTVREVAPGDIADVPFEDVSPVRTFVSWPGKRNFEGRLWMASTGEHVPFESFWERAFLTNLDRTGTARSVSSQPMWIHWREPERSHAPDYFVRRTDGTGVLVDVHPAELTDDEDAAKFALTRRLAAALGWGYVLVDDLPGALQNNLRFLLRYRDPAWLDGVDEESLPAAGVVSLGDLARLLSGTARSGIGAVYALIWWQRVSVDLTRPLSMATAVQLGGAA